MNAFLSAVFLPLKYETNLYKFSELTNIKVQC